MPSGGARTGAGRPPAENSQRKDRERKRAERTGVQVVEGSDWLTLPREGRTGNPPAWPLSRSSRPTAESKRELVLWRRVWKSPQAVGWEKVGVDIDQVALYVRYLAEAEKSDATGTVRNLVRQYADQLGMSAPGLRLLRWKIGQPARHGAAVEPAQPVRPAPGRSSRERFQLLTGGESA